MHVVEAIPEHVTFSLPSTHFGETKENVSAELNAMVQRIENVDVEVVVGHTARAILDMVKDKSVDCIVIGSHQPGLQDYFLGSTAAHVVRHARSSVHVVR